MALILSGFVCFLAHGDQDKIDWHNIGDVGVLTKIIASGPNKGPKVGAIENDVHKFLRAALPLIETIDCAILSVSSKTVDVFVSATFDYANRSVAFVAQCDFKKKTYKFRETRVGENCSVSTSYSLDGFDVIANDTLCALATARLTENGLEITDVNTF